MRLVLDCYTAVLYEPIFKLYIYKKNLAIYPFDCKATFLFIYLFICKMRELRKPTNCFSGLFYVSLQVVPNFKMSGTSNLLVLYMTSFATCMASTNTYSMFNASLEIYKRVCPPGPNCGVEPIPLPVNGDEIAPNTSILSPHPEKCCGYCSCDADCHLYGSCCLQKYDSFQQGRHYIEDSRYKSCIIAATSENVPLDMCANGRFRSA